MADSDFYQKLIAKCFPQLPITSIEYLAEGWDNRIYQINGDTLFRFPKWPEVERSLQMEIRLLPELKKRVSLQIPDFEYICQGASNVPDSFAGYRKIPGEQLTHERLEKADGQKVSRELSNFISVMHIFPIGLAAELGVPHLSPSQWRDEETNLLDEIRQQVFPLLKRAEQEWIDQIFSEYLGRDDNFSFLPVLLHSDLNHEHILFDDEAGSITGIIDFADATVGDPAIDFAGLLYDYGLEFTQQVLTSYQPTKDPTVLSRAAFYGKIFPLHEILFGIRIGDEAHLSSGLELLRREMMLE